MEAKVHDAFGIRRVAQPKYMSYLVGSDPIWLRR